MHFLRFCATRPWVTPLKRPSHWTRLRDSQLKRRLRQEVAAQPGQNQEAAITGVVGGTILILLGVGSGQATLVLFG